MTTNRLFSAGVEWANKNHQRAASMTATNQANAVTYLQPELQAQKGAAPVQPETARSQPGGDSR